MVVASPLWTPCGCTGSAVNVLGSLWMDRTWGRGGHGQHDWGHCGCGCGGRGHHGCGCGHGSCHHLHPSLLLVGYGWLLSVM